MCRNVPGFVSRFSEKFLVHYLEGGKNVLVKTQISIESVLFKGQIVTSFAKLPNKNFLNTNPELSVRLTHICIHAHTYIHTHLRTTLHQTPTTTAAEAAATTTTILLKQLS